MRVVVQRVKNASVTIANKITGEIGQGLVVLVAINSGDNEDTIKWMCNKLVNLRIFPDSEDKMNRSVLDSGGSILLISNFTLYGDVEKGFRPSFTASAPPELSKPLYLKMVEYLRNNYPVEVATGEFGAMMDVQLVNDGPVTIIIDK